MFVSPVGLGGFIDQVLHDGLDALDQGALILVSDENSSVIVLLRYCVINDIKSKKWYIIWLVTT